MNNSFVINALQLDRREYIKIYFNFIKINFCSMKSYNLIKGERLIFTYDKIP